MKFSMLIFFCLKICNSKYLGKNKKGSIVNIGSIVGNNGFKELSGYASTKTALIGLTKSFAAEMALFNIRANIINPGFIETSYFKKFKKRICINGL